MKYDVIIVGGGPAGSTAAFCLQKAGWRCLIVDKKPYIGEKTCGGLLTWSGIQTLGTVGLNAEELLHMGAISIRQFVYVHKHATTVHYYHTGEYGLGLQRHLLDQWLLEHAITAGASWKPKIRLKEIIHKNNLFYVKADSASKLIIATGASGLIPQSIGPALKEQTFGLSAQITGKTSLDPNATYFYIVGKNDLDYFWIIPNGVDLWNIGIWFQQVPINAVTQFWRYKSEFVDKFFSEISFIRSLRGAFCGNVDFSRYFPQECYTIGDAAGQNQATTGEGLRYAITSAAALANRIIKRKQ